MNQMYQNPQEQIQQAIKYAEDSVLGSLQQEHRDAYIQLKNIISQRGTQQLNEEQRNYFQQMDQYVEQTRRQAINALCAQDPKVAQYCREIEQRHQQQQIQQPTSTPQIDFASQDYHNQLRTYVQEINASPFDQLEYKLRTLYVSLISKNYSRNTGLQHLRNVLQSLDQVAQQTGNHLRTQEIKTIWLRIQQINNDNPQILDLWDSRPIQVMDEEDDSFNVNGQYIKSIPFTYPDDVITYMVLPTRAQLSLNTRLRAGEQIPNHIYIKRRKGRPSKDTGVAHEYYTPVFVNGMVDREVLEFFQQDMGLAEDINKLADQINQSREYYMRPENRTQQYQTQTQGQQAYGQMQMAYGQNNMFAKRSYRENSFDNYSESNQNFSESSEFQEEEVTEDDDNSNVSGLTDDDGEEQHTSDRIDREEPSSSGNELEDIEQELENVIDEVLDLKIIQYDDAWKYPPSLMVKPEPEDVWRYDSLRPKSSPLVPRSDGGYILERLKVLEDDFDALQSGEGQELNPGNDLLNKDQQKMFVFLVKWRGCSHIHATWELETSIQHLSSFLKIKKFKHQFQDRQQILASEKVPQTQKDIVIDQIEEIRKNQQQYLVPEKIIAFKTQEDRRASWDASLQKLIAGINQKGAFESDAMDGSFVRNVTDNMLHYNNLDNKGDIDKDGYVTSQTAGVDKFKGYLYLIKWNDLPYQECTWELHEDLAACKHIGEEMLKELRKQYKNAGKSITKILLGNNCKFGTRQAYQPFDSPKPSFLVDVNDKFELKPHQVRGVNALLSNWSNNRNMILADPQNLGKSIQAIAFMSALYHQCNVPGPFFVIVPTSKVSEWQEAIANWFPDASVSTLLGSKEDRRMIIENELIVDNVHRFHIMLTTISIAQIEETQLKKFRWRLMCIDEAHQLRDKDGKRNRIFTEFMTDAKLLITHQPIGTNINDFYSLLHFIDPDQFHTLDIFSKLGSLDLFKDAVKQCEIVNDQGEKQLCAQQVIPLQQVKATTAQSTLEGNEELLATKTDRIILSDDESDELPQGQTPSNLANTFAGAQVTTAAQSESLEDKMKNIVNVIKPYILRRDVNIIQKQNLPKNEYVLSANLVPMQEKYMKIVLDLSQSILKFQQGESTKIQNVLVQLKKICTHPYVFKSNQIQNMTLEDIINNSGKFQVIDSLLTKFKADNHKVLIYTQQQHVLNILIKYCQLKQYKYQSLFGTQSAEDRSRAIGAFNKSESQDFVFLLVAKQGQQGLNLQTADRVIIVDTEINAQLDLQLTGRAQNFGQTRPVEIYRFATTNSVEEKIMAIAKRKLALEHVLYKQNIDVVSIDNSIMKHILENGCKQLVNNQAVTNKPVDQIISSAEKLNYMNLTDAERQELQESQFNDFKQYNEQYWSSYFAEQSDYQQEPQDYSGSLAPEQFKLIVEGLVHYGSWKFASKINSGLIPQQTAQAMFSIIKVVKQTASEFGVDIFALPNNIQFTYLGNEYNAVPVLKSYFAMFLIEQHVRNDRFRMSRASFEIAEFANAWGYVHDTRLLLTAKQNGLKVANFTTEQIERIICDAHFLQQNVAEYLQTRLDNLCIKLQSISSQNFIEKLNEDGLHTNIQYENVNETLQDEKEMDLIKKFEASQCQFPIIRDVARSTFNIELQQKIFKTCLQQLQKFFNQDRKQRVNALVTKFHEFSKAKIHYEDFRGVSVLSGVQRLKKRVISMYEKFDSSESDDNLLFKIYIQILNVVYSKMTIITQQCDEHILQLKLKQGSLQEMDNDSLIQDYVKELFDYLYRAIWQICQIQLLPTPFVLAKICEHNAAGFDEDAFECGQENDDIFIILRKEKGVKNTIEDDAEENGNINNINEDSFE